MPKNHDKWITTAVVLTVNLLLWVIPSNVAYLITQQRDVLLGRYSLDRLITLFILFPISLLILYLTWSDEKNKKKRQFQVLAVSVSIFLSIVVMDTFLRVVQQKRYVMKGQSFHREPNTVDSGVTKDIPESAYAYPRTAPGYPDIRYELTIDKRGFRNKTDYEKYDIVVLGDSFAEGSGVSDEQAWPVLLAQKSGQTVYNLGMSGGYPGTYVEVLRKFGLPLSPKTVICMLYEGNDFRSSNFRKKSGFSYNLKNYFRSSPLRRIVIKSIIRFFSENSGSASVADMADNVDNEKEALNLTADSIKALSWLPVAIPNEPNAHYYTFKIKKLLAHFETKDDFLSSPGCRKTFELLLEMKNLCNEKKVTFIVVYAPDEPRILLPLVRNIITPEQLHAFISLKKKDLPPTDELMDVVFERLDIQELSAREFCEKHSIAFVSLTEPLQKIISEGQQAYFTYDQHWTPIGHGVTAQVLANYVSSESRNTN